MAGMHFTSRYDLGIDLIVLVRPGAKESNFFTIERALLSLGRRAEIIENHTEATI